MDAGVDDLGHAGSFGRFDHIAVLANAFLRSIHAGDDQQRVHSLERLFQVARRVVVARSDFDAQRLRFAEDHYRHEGIEYVGTDIRKPLNDLGMFDFIWVRFVLEYYRLESFDIVKNISKILKPGGILCLIDLDCNCLRHYGHSDRLQKYLNLIMNILENEFNFDPYAGIKLYSYLYDIGYQDIDVNVTPHNLIFGELKDVDNFNFTKKAEMVGKQSGIQFDDYTDGFDGFFNEFLEFFSDFRRFSYTPLIACRGSKPIS